MPRDNQPSSTVGASIDASRRNMRLRHLIKHCTDAKGIADSQDEKFLSYMLAMTIQAAQGRLRGREASS